MDLANKKEASRKKSLGELGELFALKALASEKKYKAKACWMAIQFDRNSYSIYFGHLKVLNGSRVIPVDKCEEGIIGEIWAQKKRHYFDFDYYTNRGNQYRWQIVGA